MTQQRPLYADACEPQRYIVVGHDDDRNNEVADRLGEHASVIVVAADSMMLRFIWVSLAQRCGFTCYKRVTHSRVLLRRNDASPLLVRNQDVLPAAEPEREHVVITLPLRDKDVAYRLASMLVRRYGATGFPESLAVALCDLSTDDQCPFHHLVFNAGAQSLGCITL